MATKTFEELKQLAIQIRDEKTNKQNTATRIGTQMLEHLNKLEQDYYDKTATDEELKQRDEKLSELSSQTSNIYLLMRQYIFNMKTFISTDGVVRENKNYYTTDFLKISTIQDIEISNVFSHSGLGIVGVAFYDKALKYINGYIYDIPGIIPTFKIDDILANYPNAVYVKLNGIIPIDITLNNIIWQTFDSKDEYNVLSRAMINRSKTWYKYDAEAFNKTEYNYLAKDSGIIVEGETSEAYFVITPFIPVKGLDIIHYDGGGFTYTALWVQYDKNKKIIGVENSTANGSIKKDVNILPNAYFIRFCSDVRVGKCIVTAKEFKTVINNNISEVITEVRSNEQVNDICERLNFIHEQSILLDNGEIMFDSGFDIRCKVSDYIELDKIKGYTLKNLVSYKKGQFNPIAFYDRNYQVIGKAYTPTETTTLTQVDIVLDDKLLANYPNAKYILIGIYESFDYKFISPNLNKLLPQEKEPYPSFLFNQFATACFCGDSVTQGFVTEGTKENPQTIYQVMENCSYPVFLNRIYPKLDVTVKALSGATPAEWRSNFYAGTDFSQFDLIVFELGLNGGLNIDDIDTVGTNTNDYRKIIQDIRAQNQNAMIVLLRSSGFAMNWIPVLEYIANESDCKIVDLKDPKYLDLQNPIYHGYYNNVGVPEIDYAHFTRKGYNAKAYVVARMIADLLTSETVYN